MLAVVEYDNNSINDCLVVTDPNWFLGQRAWSQCDRCSARSYKNTDMFHATHSVTQCHDTLGTMTHSVPWHIWHYDTLSAMIHLVLRHNWYRLVVTLSTMTNLALGHIWHWYTHGVRTVLPTKNSRTLPGLSRTVKTFFQNIVGACQC